MLGILNRDPHIFGVSGPIPVRQRDGLIDVLQLEFEEIQVRPMPSQELLPAVLALVGMDARPECETALVLIVRIERFHPGDGGAQPAPLVVGKTTDVLALPKGAGIAENLIGRAVM